MVQWLRHPMQGAWVQSLVRELRSHMPRSADPPKKKKKNEGSFITVDMEIS